MTKTITITDDGKTKTSELMAELKKQVGVYSYWSDKDLDKYFLPKKSERQFAIEAESSAMKGSSWDEMKEIREDMMTFREYILYFAAYFHETGKYPDEEGWTVFKDGLPDGGVARGGWAPYSRRARFRWNDPGHRYSRGGARVAISLSPSATLVPSAMGVIDINAAIERVKQDGYLIYKQI